MAMNMLIVQKTLKDWSIQYDEPTYREDIRRWFDEKYSGGIAKLMELEDQNEF